MKKFFVPAAIVVGFVAVTALAQRGGDGMTGGQQQPAGGMMGAQQMTGSQQSQQMMGGQI